MTMERAHQLAPSVQVEAEGKYAAGQNPFELQGIHHFPAKMICCGAIVKPGGDLLVQLRLVATSPIGNSLGTFLRMTPEGARELAGFLIAHAVQVEAHVAAQADAAIEKASNAGGGQ